MGNVIRDDKGKITHTLYTIHQGNMIMLTVADSDRMYDVGGEEVEQYYSGEDHEEVQSLKEDIASIITGKIDPKVIALNVARHCGIIKDKVLEIPM